MESQLPTINDLPYDIFRKIIIYAYTYTPKPYQRGEDFSHKQALAPPFPASHVCRAWRCALIPDQSMWTTLTIPGIKPCGIKELIYRSQSAPLHISLYLEERGMRYNTMSEALSCIAPHINRVESLRVYIRVHGYPNPNLWSDGRAAPIRQLLSFLQQPAPKLQVFSFSNMGAEYYFQTLFSGSTPNLKHINYQVSGVAYQGLSCPSFHGLSELHLSCLEDAKLENVLALLKLCSSLEVFGIYIYPWAIHHSPSERSEPVHLPRLQRLLLQMPDPKKLINFVNGYLDFPPNVQWDISALIDHLFQYSPPLLELIPQVRFTTLQAVCKSPVKRRGDKTVFTDFDQIDGNKLAFDFHDTPDLTGIQWCDLVMFRSIDFSSVTHFNLELVSRATSLQVKKLFSTVFSVMENLQCLVVKQEVMFRCHPENQACLQSLSVLISSGQDGTRPLCPSLRRIIVKLEDPFFGPPKTMFHLCYKERQNSNRPLKILVYCPEAWHPGVKSVLQLEDDIPLSARPSDGD